MAKDAKRKKTRTHARAQSKSPTKPQKRADASPKTQTIGGNGDEKSPQNTLRVVGIGASAGGLEALETFFHAVPPDTGAAFVVVTHLHPDQVSMLPQILGKATSMHVSQIEDGMTVQPNEVYVIPPNTNVGILNHKLLLVPRDREKPSAPVNYFLRSLALDKKELAAAIILSGTGSDGTDGIRAIKSELGLVMAQDPETASFKGMPEAAIQTRVVDFVLPPGKMPAKLAQFYDTRTELVRVTPRLDTDTYDQLQKLLMVLRSATGHDFSQYKHSPILRRVERRMRVHNLETMERYLHYLRQNPQEVDALFRELLIGVTDFFRDPDAFEIIAKRVLPAVLGDKPDRYNFRAWTPGVATGEEAYSLAMLVQEYARQNEKSIHAQIFATDINGDAIDLARRAVYPPSIETQVPPERLRNFFVRGDHGYKIVREIREMVIFSIQNMIKDPPFTNLDLLCCRNLLIYLDGDHQKRLLPLFHYCLKPGGILFLGSSESIGEFGNLFTPLDSKWKIFQRNELDSATQFTADYNMLRRRTMNLDRVPGFSPNRSVPQMVERHLLETFAPACAIVNRQGEIYYIHGRTGKYLEPASGHANLNIFDMAREGLNSRLQGLITKAGIEKKTVQFERLKIGSGREAVEVNVSVHPVADNRSMDGLYMVAFEDAIPEKAAPARRSKASRTPVLGTVESLESELAAAQESLKNTIEELQTSNEELRTMNEEHQSTNEELQSANEELETSREEMHSLNEELTTVNTEMQDKIDDLSRSHQDLETFLNSLEIPTIFLDHEFRVLRFTPQAKRLVNLVSHDVGRPLAHISSNFEGSDLVAEASRVLETLRYSEKEVEDKDGNWYLMRIVPYRRSGSDSAGVAITFVNIDELKMRTLQLAQMRIGRDIAEEIIDTVPMPVVVLDEDHLVVSANDSFFAAFRLSRRAVLGNPIEKCADGVWSSVAMIAAIDKLIREDVAIENFEIEGDLPGAGSRNLVVFGRRLKRQEHSKQTIMLVVQEKKRP
jgi:two-component system CheB/CheR fusion protein